MTNGNAGISDKEFSPIGSAETLWKDCPGYDFSVIRQKGISVSRGDAEKTHKQCTYHQTETR